jgi:hypothetical protein
MIKIAAADRMIASIDFNCTAAVDMTAAIIAFIADSKQRAALHESILTLRI